MNAEYGKAVELLAFGAVPQPASAIVGDGPGPYFAADDLAFLTADDPVAELYAGHRLIALSDQARAAVDVWTGGPGLVGTDFGPGADESSVTVLDAAGVTVDASSAAGVRWALTTLVHMLRAARRDDSGVRLPAGTIQDEPRFAWRGLSVDVARNFLPVPALETVIDIAADLKLNVLHLHLTDDQGWRLEIPGYPQLVARSGSTSTLPGGAGFLTVADYQHLQDVAARRGIVVVPEIDVPGHTNAALHALGELNADGQPLPAYTGVEVGFSQLVAGTAATQRFLSTVFAQVAAMTAGPWIHFGGDECLQMTAADYRTLVTSARDAVLEAGKVPVAWQEAAAGGADDALLQVWDLRRGFPPAVLAAAQNHGRVVLSPAPELYLDMKYDAQTPWGQDWAGMTDIDQVYAWDPEKVWAAGLPQASTIGVEATIWTETMVGIDAVTTMLLPRLAAVAETGWTPRERRDAAQFRARLAPWSAHWNARGIAFYPSQSVDWS